MKCIHVKCFFFFTADLVNKHKLTKLSSVSEAFLFLFSI